MATTGNPECFLPSMSNYRVNFARVACRESTDLLMLCILKGELDLVVKDQDWESRPLGSVPSSASGSLCEGHFTSL